MSQSARQPEIHEKTTLSEESTPKDAPFVKVGDRKVMIAVEDRGLIPPWDGFSLRTWLAGSRRALLGRTRNALNKSPL